MSDYNDGVLLNYLDPREQTRSFSPLPWALRATAPTDHNMAQKEKSDKLLKASTSLSKRLIEKHQIALDASGLTSKQQYFGWESIQRNKVMLLMVLAIGYVAAATLKSNPLIDPQMTPTIHTTITEKINNDLEDVVAIKNDAAVNNNKAEKPVRGFNEQHSSLKKVDMFDFFHYNAADSAEKKASSKISVESVASNEKVIDNTSKIIISKVDDAKTHQSQREENSETKKEDADSSANSNAKDKPNNILRAVRKMIRSAICALRNKSGKKCG